MKAPELLSPAGTLKNMRYALAYGADAVYAGMPRYSLRVRNNDFNRIENLAAGIAAVHADGKAFFLASNVLPHNSKVRTFLADMEPVMALGPDALIMAAAVADFRPLARAEIKISRADGLDLRLEPTTDILAEAAATFDDPRYRGAGDTLADFLAQHLWDGRRLARSPDREGSARDPPPRGSGTRRGARLAAAGDDPVRPRGALPGHRDHARRRRAADHEGIGHPRHHRGGLIR